ncbi:MAG: glutamine amidotransferase [Burkholderiaceae bacterium]
MKKLIIVKIGNTFSDIAKSYGDFEHWIQAGTGQADNSVAVIDPRVKDELPHPDGIAGVVISGSHAMVTERAHWSEALEAWIAELIAYEVPLLGICYGHQLIAAALDGEVDYHPRGVEAGTVTVRCTEQAMDDALFHDLPLQFPAQTIHWQSVLRLPPGAVLLAGNSFEPHHAFRIGECAWGVQFHPEFSSNIMHEYLCRLGSELSDDDRVVEALLNRVNRTDWAALILKRFGTLVREHSLRAQEAAHRP